MEGFEVGFIEMCAQVLSLRDGVGLRNNLSPVTMLQVLTTDVSQLFNASSAVESRASTRLGENVKLLTYVIIFYLPFIAVRLAIQYLTIIG
jgi:hypothetical protein